MGVIDLEKLRVQIEKEHDPFEFYLYVTIKGECPLNGNHPYINDHRFLELLLSYYEEHEEFEKCLLVRAMIDVLKA